METHFKRAFKILVGAVTARAIHDRTTIDEDIIMRVGSAVTSAKAKSISPNRRDMAG